MAQIASDEIIQQAYEWLCERRKDYAANNDIWQVRWYWPKAKRQLQADLLAGKYRFSALQHIRGREKTLDLWSAMDALVLKALALVLGRHLKPYLSTHCYHLAGHGGAKAAVRTVRENLTGNTFVFRTDVRSYYANIDHDVLFRLLQKYVKEKKVLDLLRQYLKCSINDGGLFSN